MPKYIVKDVLDKLNEYNVEILYHHNVDEKQYAIFCKDMAIFAYPDEYGIGIAFQATTKPDEAAQYSLIMCELENIKIEILESFIYDQHKKIIFGNDAYKLVNDSIRSRAIEEYRRSEIYNDLLNNVECFEC